MSPIQSIPHVGAQVPEMKNSPIVDDTDDEIYVVGQEVEEQPCCYYNNTSYDDGSYVNTGADVLVCNKGLWIYQSSSDPDKP